MGHADLSTVFCHEKFVPPRNKYFEIFGPPELILMDIKIFELPVKYLDLQIMQLIVSIL